MSDGHLLVFIYLIYYLLWWGYEFHSTGLFGKTSIYLSSEVFDFGYRVISALHKNKHSSTHITHNFRLSNDDYPTEHLQKLLCLFYFPIIHFLVPCPIESIPNYIGLQTTRKLTNHFTRRADLHCERHYWHYNSEHFCLPFVTDGFRRGKLGDWHCNNLVCWR